MAGGSRALLALAAVVLAVGLAACGGGDGDETTAPAGQERSGGESPGGGDQAGQGKAGGGDDSAGGDDSRSGDSGGGSAGSGSSGGSGASGDDNPSGDDSGGGDSASGRSTDFSQRSQPFRIPGGDNSIQSFGAEASAAERDAPSAALEAYMRARAADDGQGQCAHLARAAVQPMEELLSRSPDFEGKGCAAILAALGSRSDPSLRANTMSGPIASLRVEGDRAFALYHGRGGTDYFIPMVKEGGEWKVATVGGPTEFP